ncbi:MAG: hypothetical protein GXY83_05640 [Rhodopirellula sp.]|nr:hypothetical protein [Rhodopirellula sp.]
MLSLVLTSLVLLCVGMAVDSQLRIADAGRVRVEEAQLARVLLHRIAGDIRGAVVTDPLGLAELAAGAASSETSTDTSANSADNDAADPSESADETSSDTAIEAEATGGVESLVPHAIAGLYGESDWIQIDVNRPTRVYGQASSSSDSTSPLLSVMGDLKTVAYSVVAEDESSPIGAAPSSGLIRRELERSVTSWAAEQGLEDQLLLGETPIAPEVAAVAFRYSDGSTWYDSWDTAEAENLPLAVEISLSLRPIRHETTALSSMSGEVLSEEDELLVYRLIVDLPLARAKPATGASEEEMDQLPATQGNASF